MGRSVWHRRAMPVGSRKSGDLPESVTGAFFREERMSDLDITLRSLTHDDGALQAFPRELLLMPSVAERFFQHISIVS